MFLSPEWWFEKKKGKKNMKKGTKCKWDAHSLALIVKWLTFSPKIRAGFSSSPGWNEMLMVLPTQFNVNPILLFPLLGRSSLSLFPYTAAGGTDSRLTPPSGSGESAQDRKRRRNRRWVEEDPLVHAGVFFWREGETRMQTVKPYFASVEFHPALKEFNNNWWWPHTGREWQVFVVFPLPYWSHLFFIHQINFYCAVQTSGLNSHETKQNLHTAKIWVRQCITCWDVMVGRNLKFICKRCATVVYSLLWNKDEAVLLKNTSISRNSLLHSVI